MTTFILPKFDVPPLPPKKVPPDVQDALFLATIRTLKESGEYDRLCDHPSRRPASVRFSLSSF